MNKNNNNINNSGNSNNNPLLISQPYNLIVWLSFYSPIVLAISITMLSFVFQNFKGFIYLGFLVAVSVARNYVYKYTGAFSSSSSSNSICDSVQYSNYGNNSFSMFVFAFTIMYLSMTMFIYNNINFFLFIGLIVFAGIDFGIKYNNGCVKSIGEIFANGLVGAGLAAGITGLMYAGGSAKHLFFNETSSTKEVCSKPTDQTFKCSVYKNGELIGAV